MESLQSSAVPSQRSSYESTLYEHHASSDRASTDKQLDQSEHEISRDQEASSGRPPYYRHLSLIVEADVETNAALEKPLSRAKSKDPNLV